MEKLEQREMVHPRIQVMFNAEPVNFTGILGNFTTTVIFGKERLSSRSISHGAIIIATGGKEYKPVEYLYGRHPAVMTHLDFDAAESGGSSLIKEAQSVAFIQCVGSRIRERPYCSRVCCTHTLQSAIRLKKEDPERAVFVFYRDIRSYGFREQLYREALGQGVLFVRYDPDNPPEVSIDDGGCLRVTVSDHILGLPLSLSPDLLVLAAAILPNENRDLFELFKVPVNEDGFLVEAHAKLRPVDFASEGIFLAGLAHYPKSIDETISQARAAVSRACTIISRGEISVGGVVAEVAEPSRCAACLICVRSCPYGVPKIKEGRAVIEPAQCHGCGICAAECPAKVITLKHFTDIQINAKTDALFQVAS